jgi:phage terminase large subunit
MSGNQSKIDLYLDVSEKQMQAWEKLSDLTTTEIFFGGGAGGGKSFLGCLWIVSIAQQMTASRWFIGRQTLQLVKKSTLLTLFDVFRLFGYQNRKQYRFNQQDNVITLFNGSEIYLLDLDYYPSDPMYERLGSMEFTGGFVDESPQITAMCKDVLKTRIRYKLTEFGLIPKLLLTGNPSKLWPYSQFYKPARDGNLPSDLVFIQALAKDNPFIPASYIKSLKDIRDKVLYQRLWLGNWEYEDDENSLFAFEDILDIFTNIAEPSELKYITCDAARKGRDRCIILVWRGLKVIAIRVLEKSLTTQVETEILAMAAKYNVQRSKIIVDEDGVGGGIVDHLACKGFIGGSSPYQPNIIRDNQEFRVNYLNLRAQCYYTLSDYVAQGKISFRTKILEYQQFITEELEQIRAKDVDKENKLRIIPKEEIKGVLQRSPDFADTLMMRMYFEVNKQPVPNIRIV